MIAGGNQSIIRLQFSRHTLDLVEYFQVPLTLWGRHQLLVGWAGRSVQGTADLTDESAFFGIAQSIQSLMQVIPELIVHD